MAYRVFICHAYDHRDIYFKLVEKLNAVNFNWRNLSVQYDMRFGDEDERIEDEELRRMVASRIADSDVMLALTKPVASRRAWLQWEIKLAKELGKPIIGVARYRNDRVSKFVRDHADEIVDTWRIDHITNAVEWSVDDQRRRRPARAAETPSSLAPTVLPLLLRAPHDEEVSPNPSPEFAPPPPPQAAQVDAQVDAREAPPAESFFREFGTVVPDPPTFVDRKPPRWWQRLGRHFGQSH